MIATKDNTQRSNVTERTSATGPPRPKRPSDSPRNERVQSGDGMSVQSREDGIPTLHAKAPNRTAPSRKPWKKDGVSVKSQYGPTLQLGFVLALAILLGLTALRFETDDSFDITLSEQDVVVMEEVAQTEQEIRAPAPPRPAAPIEVANNVVLEDETFDFDATLDLNESLDVAGPPPPPAPEPQEEEKTYEDEIFVVVEDQPELIGGLATLQRQIEYPILAQKAGIEGRVFVQFVVNEQGDVVNPTVIRGRHPLLDAEALRVIRLAKFEPGRQRGKAVKVQMAMPITFKLKIKK